MNISVVNTLKSSFPVVMTIGSSENIQGGEANEGRDGEGTDGTGGGECVAGLSDLDRTENLFRKRPSLVVRDIVSYDS